MIVIKNYGPKEFVKYISGKKFYIFGAGIITHNCVDIYCDDVQVQAIVDNSKKLQGTSKEFAGRQIAIISVEDFVECIKADKIENAVLLITSQFYGAEIVNQLDEIEALNGLECFLHPIIRNTKEEAPEFEFTQGERKIPKKIHYFWFGGNPIPNHLQECINSWKKFNPDYEVIRWDETNYDVMKVPYMREAYENKGWGFVSDYARLDILYQYGGIYLDTDVEVIGDLDVLRGDDAFFGMASGDRIGTGVGFGTVPGHELIKALRDYYHDKPFVNADGSLNRQPCYYYQHPILKEYGFKILNEYQKVDNVVVYPAEVMSPKGTGSIGDFYSEKTVSVHHGSGTWIKDGEKSGMSALKELIANRL